MNEYQNKAVFFKDLGSLSYAQALEIQLLYFNEVLQIKTGNRLQLLINQSATLNYLFFCEHPHVYTLGKSGLKSNLLKSTNELMALGAAFYETNRGGDITYHGPGQLVVYPVIDLENFFTDIHRYMRSLEEAVILTLQDFGLIAGRLKGLTGVWIDVDGEPRKICAMGVKTSRWVAMHGLALNVNPALKYFDHIIPCGIAGKKVTSMAAECDTEVPMAQVKQTLKKYLSEIFLMKLVGLPDPIQTIQGA